MYPILCEVQGVSIRAYSVGCYLVFLIAYGGSYWRAKHAGYDPSFLTELALVLLVPCLVATRLTYAYAYPAEFIADPWQLLRIWDGGVTWYGGVIGGTAAGIAWLRYRGLPVGDVCDLVVPFVALGHAVGRLGCFLNGCCYGAPTALWLGVHFPGDPAGVLRHPAQLYEAGLETLNFLILDQLWRRGKRGGRVMVSWIVLYAGERFLLETLRGDTIEESYLFGLTLAQSTALVLAAVAAAVAWRMRRTEV